jgi:large subunit ribosomal protein L32
MAVPRNRTSKSKRGHRRSHHAKVPANVLTCTNCKESTLPHRICPSCGFYGGKAVLSKA